MLFKKADRPAPPVEPELVLPEPDSTTPQLRLSQSLIRNIEADSMCPQFYKEYHWLQQHILPPSQAQLIGQYFEWLALNNKPRGGAIVVPGQTSRGAKPVDVKRIEEQAGRVVSTLERHDMYVVTPQGHESPSITMRMPLEEYPDIMFEGTFDFVASHQQEPGVFTITDLKATKTLHSSYGPNGKPGWGDFFNMDHLQAYSYLWLANARFPDRNWRFRYAVFSYDAGKDYQIFEVDMGSMELQELKVRINTAAAKLMEWAESGFEPIGHPDCCTRCIHRKTCPAARLVKPIIYFKKSF